VHALTRMVQVAADIASAYEHDDPSTQAEEAAMAALGTAAPPQ